MFWAPLLALLAAMASDLEKKPKEQRGDPLEKTIFDILEEALPQIFPFFIAPLAKEIEAGQVTSFEAAMHAQHKRGLTQENLDQIGALTYGLAKAEKHRAVWSLDPEAYTALANTNPPWELVAGILPRLPFPAMLILLPETISVQTREMPAPVLIKSILVIEEIPGRKWRYLGFDGSRNFRKLRFTKGWFGITTASAKAQLVEDRGVPDGGSYKLWGDDIVWTLILNLMLALEHNHLDGQPVRPRVPKGAASRKLKKRKSVRPYTIVRLSGATQKARDEAQTRADAKPTPTGRKPLKRHLRTGHWKGQWKSDPGNSPVYATKPRFNRAGERVEGFLYRTAIWIFPYWAGVTEPGGSDEPPGRYRVKR